jgi:hypothetical protein
MGLAERKTEEQSTTEAPRHRGNAQSEGIGGPATAGEGVPVQKAQESSRKAKAPGYSPGPTQTKKGAPTQVESEFGGFSEVEVVDFHGGDDHFEGFFGGGAQRRAEGFDILQQFD